MHTTNTTREKRTVFFTVTNRDGQKTLSVIGDTFEKVVAATHPNFETLVNYLVTEDPNHDEEYVRGLVDPTVGIGRVLQEHFGDRLTFDMHNLYLDGLPVSGVLAKVIKDRMLAADQDWLRFARFLMNLDENPSKRAKDAVWMWVEANGLTITEDGCFLGYKGVTADGKSVSTGPDNYVNGVYYGKPGEHVQVPYEIGSVVSKKRGDVDDTPGGGCSVGLHVGTKEYAADFGERLLTVKINPRDVVSAPDVARGWNDSLHWKIRVCRLEVVDIAKPEHFASTSADPVTEEHVKDPERVAREAALAGLSDYQRRVYDDARRMRASHEDALADAHGAPETEPEDDTAVEDDTEYCNECGGEAEETTPQGVGLCGDPDCEASYYGMDTEDDEEAQAGEEPAAGEVAGGPSPDLTLAENAALVADLKADLENTSMGHKPLARKWSNLTTESSVRRYRKSNGIKTTFGAKISDAVS